MSSDIMPKNQAILNHLTNLRTDNGVTYFSGFVAAIRDARRFTKRDELTGVKLTEGDCGNPGSWLGAIGYLALLDQIGNCFRPAAEPILTKGSEIQKALKYFTSLSDTEIDAIYSLRNAFAHNFSLVNNKRLLLTHNFKVTQGSTGSVVISAGQPWDGDLNSRNAANLTTINLERLGDLAESVCFNILNLAENDQLEIVLPNGSDELLQRYSFMSGAAV